MLIGCAQAIEHYEIARYGLLKTWARKLGHEDAEELLEETLDEEKRTDALLTEIAEGLEAPNDGSEDDDVEEVQKAPRRPAAKRPASKSRAKAKA